MSERQRQVVIGLLVAVLVAAAVLVLNPWGLHQALDAPIARGLGTLHGLGLPSRINEHAAEFAANIALFVPLGLLGALLLPRRRWWVAPRFPHEWVGNSDCLPTMARGTPGMSTAQQWTTAATLPSRSWISR